MHAKRRAAPQLYTSTCACTNVMYNIRKHKQSYESLDRINIFPLEWPLAQNLLEDTFFVLKNGKINKYIPNIQKPFLFILPRAFYIKKKKEIVKL